MVNLLAFGGRAHAIHMAREQGYAQCVLDLVHFPPQGVDRLTKFVGCGAETSAADNFQEDAHRFPVGHAPGFNHKRMFALWNTLFLRRLLTQATDQERMTPSVTPKHPSTTR